MTDQSNRHRPRVALLIPTARRSDVLTPAALAHLRDVVDLREGHGTTADITQQLPQLLADADACMTGWGSPPLTDEILDAAPKLRLVAHTAGTVKRLVPANIFERGIAVSHAANVIADAVAEYTILAMLLGLRRVHEMDRAMHAGAQWRDASQGIVPLQLAARTVGLVGAGYVGRKVARLVKAFGPRLLVHDPYLTDADAAQLGVESVSLDEVFQASEVLSVHVPVTPETHHLIGARQLNLLRDGAVFINSARSWVIDQDALLETLSKRKIWAALDVFDQEPLATDSPFRQLPNVFLTPHEAGRTRDTYVRQGQEMVDEVERFFSGGELRFRIAPAAFALMA